MSAKDRPGQVKRGKPVKQRRDDSEGFDVRSQYAPFFPQQQQPAWASLQQYNPIGVPQFGNAMQSTYQGAPQPLYGQAPQQFHSGIMPGIGMPPYSQMAQGQMPLPQVAPNQMPQPQMSLAHIPLPHMPLPQMPLLQMPPNQMMHTQIPQVSL